MKYNIKTIYLAGGCFWEVEAYISRLNGVIQTETGYANGITHDPTYEKVAAGKTKHVECVKVNYNTYETTLEEILKELNCFPVFLDEEVLRSHYHGFCKKILWPVLHNSVNMLEWWDELIDRFAEDNIFANRPLMDRYFNSYSIVNDTIARCVEQL